MALHCDIEEFKRQPVLSVRTRTSVDELPKLFEKTYARISEYLTKTGNQPAGAPFAAYYNMDMKNLDIEIGFPVAENMDGKDDIVPNVIPAGKTATCLYTGAYDKIEPAYTALSDWIQKHGYDIKGVAYEFYLNDPTDTPPEKLQTKICFPLKNK